MLVLLLVLSFVHVLILQMLRNTHHVQNEYLDTVLRKTTLTRV